MFSIPPPPLLDCLSTQNSLTLHGGNVFEGGRQLVSGSQALPVAKKKPIQLSRIANRRQNYSEERAVTDSHIYTPINSQPMGVEQLRVKRANGGSGLEFAAGPLIGRL